MCFRNVKHELIFRSRHPPFANIRFLLVESSLFTFLFNSNDLATLFFKPNDYSNIFAGRRRRKMRPFSCRSEIGTIRVPCSVLPRKDRVVDRIISIDAFDCACRVAGTRL